MLELHWIKSQEKRVESVVCKDFVGQFKMTGQLVIFLFPTQFHVIPGFSATKYTSYADKHDVFQFMKTFIGKSRIFYVAKIRFCIHFDVIYYSDSQINITITLYLVKDNILEIK